MERRFTRHSCRVTSPPARSAESRQEGEASPPVVSGYGAVFYTEGDPGTEYQLYEDMLERIMPGAFDRAIQEDDVRSLFNHNPDVVLGRVAAGTLALSVDSRGLHYEAQAPDTQLVRDQVLTPIQRKDVTGSSFMFDVLERSWREVEVEGHAVFIREVHQVRLYEVGPVVFPAYEGATSSTSGARGRKRDQACQWFADARADLDAWLADRRRRTTAAAAAASARARAVELE